MSPQMIDYMAVLLLGAMIGFVEVLARYRDAPFKVAFSLPGLMYILINAGVSALALWTVRLFGIDFGNNPSWSIEAKRWVQVGVSGLSAMTLFRSSLFNFRVDEEDISVGPNAILQILLVAVDKEVDRLRGAQRARIVEEMMGSINFLDAVLNLPPVVLALMQNLTDKDRNEILNSVKEALESKVPDRSKTMTLGLSMVNVVGEDILKAAIEMTNLDQHADPKAKAKNDNLSSPQLASKPESKVIVPLEAAVSDKKISPAVDKLRKMVDKNSSAENKPSSKISK